MVLQKKLSDDDVEFVVLLAESKAPVRKIAEALSSRTGNNYKSKDVSNLLAKLKKENKDGTTFERVLESVRSSGGEVRIEKDKDSGYATVIWIQTNQMKKALSVTKPQVFQCDTTFSTNRQGYKLFTEVYHNPVTDKSEIAGLLFLATEVRETVEIGLKFVRDALNYTATNKLIFFVDKDMDYIELMYAIFPGCVIFLCSVHVYRYIREKVLPSSRMSDGSRVEKVDIINQFKSVRDAPSEEEYIARRTVLFELTEGLEVAPGRKNFVTFHRYFDKNWESCRKMWVFCYRKQFPTLVSSKLYVCDRIPPPCLPINQTSTHKAYLLQL